MAHDVRRLLGSTTLLIALLAGTPGIAQAGDAFGEVLANILLGGQGPGPYDPYVYPPPRFDRGGVGPAFCQTGEGHPVYGPEWCFQKGFGLGHYGRSFERGFSSHFDEVDHEAWKREEEHRREAFKRFAERERESQQRRHEAWKRFAEEERETRKHHLEREREARKQRHEAWKAFDEQAREVRKDHLERKREAREDRREWLKERAEIDREAARRDLEAYERF